MFDRLSELSNEEKPVVEQLIAIHELLGSVIEQMQQGQNSQDNFGKNLQEEHPIAVLKKSLLAGIR